MKYENLKEEITDQDIEVSQIRAEAEEILKDKGDWMLTEEVQATMVSHTPKCKVKHALAKSGRVKNGRITKVLFSPTEDDCELKTVTYTVWKYKALDGHIDSVVKAIIAIVVMMGIWWLLYGA